MQQKANRQIVKGAEGIARFVLERIDDIVKYGATVHFAVETEVEPGDDLDTVRANSTGWYGIENCTNQRHFDDADDWLSVLFMSYYGYSRAAQIAYVGDGYIEDEVKDLADTIRFMVRCTEDGYLEDNQDVYCACEKRD